MQLDQVTLLIGVASFLGAILGAALSNWVNARNAAQERKEARRKERIDRLIGLLNALIRVRTYLQWSENAFAPNDEQKRGEAYGEAYAVMLSSAEQEIVKAAEKVKIGVGWADGKNDKLDAIDTGIQRMGELLNEIMRE